GPALTDLMGGHLSSMFDAASSSIAYIRAGKLRPLAVTTARRIEVLPDVPPASSANSSLTRPRNGPRWSSSRGSSRSNLGIPAIGKLVEGNAMKLPRRSFLHLAAGPAVLPVVPRIANAETYPSRPVHCIVGYAPGGGTDIFVRLVGQLLPARLGQPFVIENRPGASSN